MMAQQSNGSPSEGASNGKNPSSSVKDTSVGTNSTKPNGTVKAHTSSLSIASFIGCFLVAALSFGVGVLTPPLLARQETVSRPQESTARQILTKSTSAYQPTFVCDEDLLSQFLHDSPVPGMHLVCWEENENGSINLKLFPGSSNGSAEITKDVPKRWNSVRQELVQKLQLRPTDTLHQPWAIFSPVGEWLADESLEENSATTSTVTDTLVQLGVVLIFQGGQWIWPGVRIGFQRKVALYSIMPRRSPNFAADPAKHNRSAILETISLQPLVFSVLGFLTEQECDHIKERAAPDIKYSEVSLMDHDEGRPASDFRTSQSAFVNAGDDEILIDIDYRTASLVRIPRDQQEDVQVLRYGLNEHYFTHHDFFDPSLYQNDFMTQFTIQNGRRNRLATVFWYLNDVEEGGETFFPRFQNAIPPDDPSDCSTGLKVKPQRGKVIIFYSMTPDGGLDQLSLHGSCDVKKGVKWAANKWVWNAPATFMWQDGQ